MAYELYHLAETGVDFYGEGDMFDGGGMFEGLETLREPLLKTPQEYLVRPGSCEVDEVWELLKACMNAEAGQAAVVCRWRARLARRGRSCRASTKIGCRIQNHLKTLPALAAV